MTEAKSTSVSRNRLLSLIVLGKKKKKKTPAAATDRNILTLPTGIRKAALRQLSKTNVPKEKFTARQDRILTEGMAETRR